ncbi:MAG: hypothetical protein C5B55_00950 [Blastocatellia bacterium]|nr:MAG: hypothetical protein C5B55_00950 [Blastocatellia bacterium]
MHSHVFSYESWVKTIRWLARGSSLAVIAVLALFIIGENNSVPIRVRDLAGLALFPVGVVLGMLVSWKHELEGSLISIGSLIGFYFACALIAGSLPDGWAFVVFTSPAFLFLVTGVMDKFHHSHIHHPYVRRV